MSRNERRLLAALAELGCVPREVRWEPIGPNYEMCGRSGGWMIDGEPFGLSTEQALAFIRDCPNGVRGIFATM